MGERSRYEEYLVCQDRGHEASGMRAMSNPPQDICKWCGTHYRVIPPGQRELGAIPKPEIEGNDVLTMGGRWAKAVE